MRKKSNFLCNPSTLPTPLCFFPYLSKQHKLQNLVIAISPFNVLISHQSLFDFSHQKFISFFLLVLNSQQPATCANFRLQTMKSKGTLLWCFSLLSAGKMSAPAINMRFSIPPTLTAAGKSTQTHFQSQPCRPSSNMKWTEQKIFISRIFKFSARLKIFIFFENIFPSFKNSISLSRSDRFIISTESTSFSTRFFSTFHLTKNILFWPSLLH